jgi:hypothetical protein
MKRPNLNQVVGYVAPPARPGQSTTIKNGIVLESFEGEDYRGEPTVFARLDITEYDGTDEEGKPKPKNAKETVGHHTAIAAFDSTRKQENTWHFLAEESATPPKAGKPQPATPAV